MLPQLSKGARYAFPFRRPSHETANLLQKLDSIRRKVFRMIGEMPSLFTRRQYASPDQTSRVAF